MDPLSVARGYFEAWNRHDSPAIVAAFHVEGTYRDPASGVLVGEAIGRYADRIFAAFPDLEFELITAAPAGERLVAAQWVMRGTNTGPLFDGPPTGKGIALPGADFIATEGECIRSVSGYFDQKEFAQQLGLQTIVQPYALGSITFGTSLCLSTGGAARPGAVSITRIAARDETENAEIEQRASAVLEELAETPGFIGSVLTTTGLCGHTITAWEDAEAARRLLTGKAHKDAMSRFLGQGFAAGGMTSVWTPLRINMWLRCESCGTMVRTDNGAPGGTCRCGRALAADFTFL